MTQMNLSTKQKQTHRLREWTYGYQGWRVGESDRLGVWDWHVHTAIFKIDNQKEPAVNKQTKTRPKQNKKLLTNKSSEQDVFTGEF